MVNIQIRDIPQATKDTLAEVAHRHGQSMQAYLKDLLLEDARRARNATLLQQVRAVGGGYTGSSVDAAEEMTALREQRDREIAETA